MDQAPTASLESQCAACKRKGTLLAWQVVEGGLLQWKESFSCECGHGFEAGGAGAPAPAVRQALLAQAGIHEVVWRAGDAKQGAALLATVLSMGEEAAAERIAGEPPVVFVGTETEAGWLLKALGERGIEVEVRRVG